MNNIILSKIYPNLRKDKPSKFTKPVSLLLTAMIYWGVSVCLNHMKFHILIILNLKMALPYVSPQCILATELFLSRQMNIYKKPLRWAFILKLIKQKFWKILITCQSLTISRQANVSLCNIASGLLEVWTIQATLLVK